MLNSHLIKDAGAAGAPRGPPRPPSAPLGHPFNLICAPPSTGPADELNDLLICLYFNTRDEGVICLTETVEGERWTGLHERSNLLEVNARRGETEQQPITGRVGARIILFYLCPAWISLSQRAYFGWVFELYIRCCRISP